MLLSLGVSSWVVHLSIAYAHRRGMLDQPGKRRSHSLPTARGGGIGIVVACVLVVPWALLASPAAASGWLVGGLIGGTVMVALVGWLDDHQPLGVLPRLGVQLLASGLFGVSLLADGHAWWWLLVLVPTGAWSVNLHNFMDGIDGLLAQQLVFVASGIGLLAAVAGQPALAGGALVVAAAGMGFLPYNWAPARVFMGDVGSGAAGFLLFGLAAALSWWRPSLTWPVLVLGSAFVTDASLTLLSRFLRGRRWYSPHREHLYQWLVRSGWSHRRCATAYLGWNLLVAAPAVVLMKHTPEYGFAVCLFVYTIAATTWIVTKRRCLRRDLHEATHGST